MKKWITQFLILFIFVLFLLFIVGLSIFAFTSADPGSQRYVEIIGARIFLLFGLGWFLFFVIQTIFQERRAKRCAGVENPEQYRDDVNRYAVEEARKHIKKSGWHLVPASPSDPYDLVGTKSGKKIHVIAKGTWEHRENVEFPPLGKNTPYDTVYFIQQYVTMKPGEKGVDLSGGKSIITWPSKLGTGFRPRTNSFISLYLGISIILWVFIGWLYPIITDSEPHPRIWAIALVFSIVPVVVSPFQAIQALKTVRFDPSNARLVKTNSWLGITLSVGGVLLIVASLAIVLNMNAQSRRVQRELVKKLMHTRFSEAKSAIGRKDWETAERKYIELLDSRQNSSSGGRRLTRDEKAGVLAQLGRVSFEMGDLGKAESYFRDSVQAARGKMAGFHCENKDANRLYRKVYRENIGDSGKFRLPVAILGKGKDTKGIGQWNLKKNLLSFQWRGNLESWKTIDVRLSLLNKEDVVIKSFPIDTKKYKRPYVEFRITWEGNWSLVDGILLEISKTKTE